MLRLGKAMWRWSRKMTSVIDLVMLMTASFIVIGSWAFVELAEYATDSDPESFDRWVLLSLRSPKDVSDPVGPKWFEEGVRDITSLGGTTVLCLFLAIATGYLVICRHTSTALFLLGAAGSGELISWLLKNYYARPRPDVVPALAYVQSASFPSGHAQLSAIIFLSLGTILARVMPRRSQRIYAMAIAMLMTLLVGCSRVYLGVHYPTDVLAGWTVGTCWAMLCWFAARSLQRRRMVENLDDEDAATQLREPGQQSPEPTHPEHFQS